MDARSQSRPVVPRGLCPVKVIGLVTPWLLAACGEPADQAITEVRDSSGIFLHDSDRPHWNAGEGWSVDPTPMLRIGGADSAHEFFGVSDALLLPDARIVVAAPFELRLFTSSGDLVRAAGRQGDGPGEFRTGPHLGLRGDSVIAFDPRASRVTIFDLELETLDVV